LLFDASTSVVATLAGIPRLMRRSLRHRRLKGKERATTDSIHEHDLSDNEVVAKDDGQSQTKSLIGARLPTTPARKPKTKFQLTATLSPTSQPQPSRERTRAASRATTSPPNGCSSRTCAQASPYRPRASVRLSSRFCFSSLPIFWL